MVYYIRKYAQYYNYLVIIILSYVQLMCMYTYILLRIHCYIVIIILCMFHRLNYQSFLFKMSEIKQQEKETPKTIEDLKT